MTRFTAIPVVFWAAVGVSEAQAQRPESVEGVLPGGRIASGREIAGALTFRASASTISWCTSGFSAATDS
jgi:hypothetical protein